MEKELNEESVEDLRKPRTLSTPKKETFGSCVTRVVQELSNDGMNPETARKVARQRCVALKDGTEVEDEIKKNEDSVHESPIKGRQTSFMQSLLQINQSLGQWDQGFGADGAHYVFQGDNPFKDIGIACHNCVFFRGPASCEIVRGIIQHDGLCSLRIIPEGSITLEPAEVEEEEIPRVSEEPPPAGDSLSPEERKQVASVEEPEEEFDLDSLAAILRQGELLAAGRVKQEKDKRDRKVY
jgi:hypothetical protein